MQKSVKSKTPVGWTSPDVAGKFQSVMAEHRQTLARRVSGLRAAKGWSRLKLATEAGLSEKTIVRIEKAEPLETRPDTFDKLADALGVPVHDLDAGRPTMEELEREEGPLERIEGKLDEILSRLPDAAAELERESTGARPPSARRDADNASTARSSRRRAKAP
jgi:transcriptional regulator with XRE-family HTH domain